MLQRLRPGFAAALSATLIMSACAGSTTITSSTAGTVDAAVETGDATAQTDSTIDGESSPRSDTAADPSGDARTSDTSDTTTTDDATAGDATIDDTTTDDAATLETVPVSDERLPDGWIQHDIEILSVAVPQGWSTMTTAAEVEPVIAAAQANGAEYDTTTIRQFEDLLSTGEAIIAFGQGGDNVNAFRHYGLATSLREHELLVDQLELEFGSFAQNIAFTSEPRRFNGLPGVLVRGTYQVDDEQVFMYQFATHEGTHLYFVTLTLFTGDDPRLATDLFKNFDLN